MRHRRLSPKSSATGVDEVKKTPVKYSVPPSPKEFLAKKKAAKVKAIFLTSSILDRLRKLPGRRCSFAPADSNDLHTPKPKNAPISPVRPTKFRKLSSPRNGDCKACASSSKKCQELPRNGREQSLDYLSSPVRRSLRLSGSSTGSKERRVKKPKTPLFSLPKALFGKKTSATKSKRKSSNSGFTTPAMALPKCPPNYTYFRFSSPDFLDKDAAACSTSAVPNGRKKRKIWG